MGLQIRRGTNAERLTITPAAGEPIYTTDTDLLYIGDGTTVGGLLISPEQLVGPGNSPQFSNITISNIATIGTLLFASDTGTAITSRADLIGPTGYTGSIGFTGSAGTTGFTGSQGNLGYTGSLGFTGSAGSNGANGYTGSQGDIGFTGSSGAGFTGSQGNIGYTGSSGSYNQSLNTTDNVSFKSVQSTQTMSVGGYPVDVDGRSLLWNSNTQSAVLNVTNYVAGTRPAVYVRGYGQNRPGTVTTSTNGGPGIEFDTARGSTSTPYAVQSGDTLGYLLAGGYNGTRWASEENLMPGTFVFLATETFRGDATTTTNAGSRFFIRTQPQGVELNSTSRNFPILQSWTAGSTLLAPQQNLNFGNADQTTPTLKWSGTGAVTTATHIGHGQTVVTWVNTNQIFHGVPSQQLFTFTGEISGTTMTVTTLTSGNVLSLNSRIYSGANQYGFISAFGTATGGTGTYVLTTSSTVASGTLSHGPDNPGLSETNYLMLVSNRRSGVSGRRNTLKLGDSVGQIFFRGQTTDSGTSVGSTAARIATFALEDFSGSAYGTRMLLQTVSSGTTTLSPRLELKDRENIYRSDLHTFNNAAASSTIATFSTASAVLSNFANFSTATIGFLSSVYNLNNADNTQSIIAAQDENIQLGRSGANHMASFTTGQTDFQSNAFNFYNRAGTAIAQVTTASITLTSNQYTFNDSTRSRLELSSSDHKVFSNSHVLHNGVGDKQFASFDNTQVVLQPGGTNAATFNTQTVTLTGSSAIYLQSSQIQAGNGVNVPRIQGQVGLYLSAAGSGVGGEIDMNTGGSTAIYSSGTTVATFNSSTITLTAPLVKINGELEGPTGDDFTIMADGTANINLNADTVRIGDNNANATLTTHGNGDLILDPHNGNVKVGTHLLPDANNTWDLGSTSTQWRSLYVSTSTIYLGGNALSVAGGSLTLNGSAQVGYTGSQGNIGYTGSQGTTGFTGSQGNIGYTGSKGDIGYTGSQGPGITLSTASGTQSLTTSSGLLASITDNEGKLAYYNTTLGDWRYIDGNGDVFAPTYNINYLVVAGGGASDQGGGGAGGYTTGTVSVTGGTSYTITVGGGGAASGGAGSPANGGNGNNSSIASVSTSTGGGGGAWSTNTPGSGGSGGGAGQTGSGTYAGGTASPAGQGNNGGSNGGFNAPNYPGGGGGGAGAVGGNATSGSVAGVGGAGKTWFDGTTYAGGGGGGNNTNSGGGAGGSGGGGQGGYGSAQGGVTAGTVNTGGGGGGDGGTGFAGGSGVVIIRYSGGTVGSGGTITSAGGFTYHTFTASGTFTS